MRCGRDRPLITRNYALSYRFSRLDRKRDFIRNCVDLPVLIKDSPLPRGVQLEDDPEISEWRASSSSRVRIAGRTGPRQRVCPFSSVLSNTLGCPLVCTLEQTNRTRLQDDARSSLAIVSERGAAGREENSRTCGGRLIVLECKTAIPSHEIIISLFISQRLSRMSQTTAAGDSASDR
jgi:hypothetical protein